MQWEVVIGLETHAQLSTQSKIFSGSPIRFGAAPNTQASPVEEKPSAAWIFGSAVKMIELSRRIMK